MSASFLAREAAMASAPAFTFTTTLTRGRLEREIEVEVTYIYDGHSYPEITQAIDKTCGGHITNDYELASLEEAASEVCDRDYAEWLADHDDWVRGIADDRRAA